MVLAIPPYDSMAMTTPFTTRDNLSYLQKVNLIRDKVNEHIDHTNTSFADLIDKINLDFESLGIQWNAELTEVVENHIALVLLLRTEVIEQLAIPGTPAHNAIVTAAGSVYDPATALLVSDVDSDTRGALETIYGDEVYPSRERSGIVVPTAITHEAVQAALDVAATSGGCVVVSGAYATDQTLVIRSDCDLTGLTINYSGTGVAVQIGAGTSGVILQRKDIRLGPIMNAGKVVLGWSGMTIGVKATNTYGCTIRVQRVRGFVNGYYAYGLGAGNVYNDVMLLHLDNNQRNLVLGAGGSGWSNSNTYRLGSLQHDSLEGSAVSGVRQILIETAANSVNGNLFLGGSVEGNQAEYHLDCDGMYNAFEHVRWENGVGGGCRVIWRSLSTRNVVSYGYNAHTIVETHIAGSSLNRISTTGATRVIGSSLKGLHLLENTSSSGNAADVVLDPGATQTGADPATAYRVSRSGDYTKMKRAADIHPRVMLDHTNGRIYMGAGAESPVAFLGAVGTLGISLNGGNLYFSADNVSDIGAATLRPRYIRAGTAVQTGSGITASRPSASEAGAGAMWYDATLGKPIWSSGSVWKDATGTAV